MSTYPGGIYSPRTKVNRSGVVYDATKETVIFAEDVQKVDDEIVAIETELGTNPKGVYASVKAWLEALAAAITGGTKIEDADGDTSWDVEQSADENKVHGKVKGVEAFLLDDAGILTLAKQSASRATLANQQTIANTTWVKILLDTETYDIQSEFASNKFTAKTSGLYLLIGKVVYWYSDTLAAKMYVAGVYKNGVLFSDMWIQSAINAKAVTPLVIATAFLAANDYIELYAYHETGANCKINNGTSQTSLEVIKIA